MIAFVDEYWKIIHRAAGWDALRYWLLVSKFFIFFVLLNVSFHFIFLFLSGTKLKTISPPPPLLLIFIYFGCDYFYYFYYLFTDVTLESILDRA